MLDMSQSHNSKTFAFLLPLPLSAAGRWPQRAGGQKVCKTQTSPCRHTSVGPSCPLVNRDILRHCITCAKEVRRAKAKLHPPDLLLRQARLALATSQRGLAERFFLRAIVLDPSRAQTYFLYALQVQRRDPVLARELFHQGVKANPHDARILQAWGLFESKHGHMARARKLLLRSVKLEPRNAPVLRWKCLFPQERVITKVTSRATASVLAIERLGHQIALHVLRHSLAHRDRRCDSGPGNPSNNTALELSG